MQVCSRCKLEREETEYSTYWHTIQKKFRTRRVCKICVAENKKKWKMKIKTDKEFRRCPMCNDIKKISTSFYLNRKTGRVARVNCKLCESRLEKEKAQEYIKETFGGNRIPPKPNTYTNEIQRECTFNLMKSLGWTFNTENNIWYKPGIKDKNGNFKISKDKVRLHSQSKITYGELKYILELRKQKKTYDEIHAITGYDKGTLCKWVKRGMNLDTQIFQQTIIQ